MNLLHNKLTTPLFYENFELILVDFNRKLSTAYETKNTKPTTLKWIKFIQLMEMKIHSNNQPSRKSNYQRAHSALVQNGTHRVNPTRSAYDDAASINSSLSNHDQAATTNDASNPRRQLPFGNSQYIGETKEPTDVTDMKRESKSRHTSIPLVDRETYNFDGITFPGGGKNARQFLTASDFARPEKKRKSGCCSWSI
ncbi:7671_t:CDS:2 [Funneliformis caledonium]|uniref:7671_t:CDS:1 n=1 Tax=Funneliformis caledonium TaxID=1117310 RepID=A0A9N9GI80_9GLOM|nr:7671_t:CDS:2 [Funneliformis caledonium]